MVGGEVLQFNADRFRGSIPRLPLTKPDRVKRKFRPGKPTRSGGIKVRQCPQSVALIRFGFRGKSGCSRRIRSMLFRGGTFISRFAGLFRCSSGKRID